MTMINVDFVFAYHAQTQEDVAAYEAIRAAAKNLASVILEVTLTCADQQASLRMLREAVMTANAAVALRGCV